jgi:peroxiredoxin
MTAVTSNMLELATPLPAFELLDTVSGRVLASDELSGVPVVIAFICNHCPFVKHIQAGLADFGRYCAQNGVRMLAISSNDVTTHPQDGPRQMAEEAARVGYGFPYLYDETQDVAKAFRAACTPDFYVFGRDGLLSYRGQFDDSRPGNGKPVTGHDLRAAVDATVAGKPVGGEQRPSIGCNIKWKRGQAPEYA